MNIQLNLFEVETLEYLLDKFIFQQQQIGLDYEFYRHIQKMIKMQRAGYIDSLVAELEKQIKRGVTPSAVALQRQENLSYAKAAKLIEQARANVKPRRGMKSIERRQNEL